MATFDLSIRAFRVWQRNFDTFLRLWKTESWPPFVEAAITLLAFGFGLGTYVVLGGENYINFLAPGLIANTVLFGATFETTYGSYIRMEMQRTFDAIISTPVSIEDVIAGEIVWAATRSAFSAVALLIMLTAFGLVSSPWAILILPVAFAAGLMFGSFGMTFTAITPSINAYNYYFTLFVTPCIFFGAVFFPPDRLPEVAQKIIWFVPTSHVSILFRAFAKGDLSPALLIDVLWIVVVTIVFFYLALVRMKRRLIK
jgi:lipooligosaccharide transport system permease protein